MPLQAAVDVGLAAALLAGLLSLLSPCSVMLLPAFFAYAFDSAPKLLLRTVVFYAGLVTTLVPLGIFAGGLGSLISERRSLLALVGGIALIALGIVQALAVPIPGLGTGPARGSSAPAVYLLGAVYGLAGACSGPLLGSVLAFAAFGASPGYGGALMAAYALGMAAPLFLLALLWGRLPGVRRLVRPRPLRLGRVHTTWAQFCSGIVTLALGVALIVTDGFTTVGGLSSVDLQFRLESSAADLAARVSDLTVVGALLIVFALVALLRTGRSDRSGHQDDDGAPDELSSGRPRRRGDAARRPSAH